VRQDELVTEGAGPALSSQLTAGHGPLEQMITKSCAPSLRGTNNGPGEEAAESIGVGRVREGFAGEAALALGFWR